MAKKGNVKSRSRRREKEGRPERWRKYNQFFLIVCEDTKTEPAYFDQFKRLFPLNTLYLKSVGTGLDQLGVVEAAIKYRKELSEETLKDIDFTWAVFDKDNADKNKTTKSRFENAYAIAQKNKIEIALSNEAFELWLLLHFTNVTSDKSISRHELYVKLENLIKKFKPDFSYRHGNTEVIQLTTKYGNENKAIERALKLYNNLNDKLPIERNPTTEIYKLVIELRNWISFYQNEIE